MAPFAWPAGHRAALSLTFDVDAESAVLAVDPVYARRLSTMSHQRYGPKVGVPRILRMLERTGVRATFFVPGLTADLHPAMVEAVLAAGHELGHHGYSHVPYHRMTDDEQRRDIDRAFASLERAGGGIRPDGFRAPWWELTNSTPAILSEFGFAWDSSLMDDDRPYLLDTGTSVLAELPVHWMLDDWEQYAFLPEPTHRRGRRVAGQGARPVGLRARGAGRGGRAHGAHEPPVPVRPRVARGDARAGGRAGPRARRRLDRAAPARSPRT